MDWRKLIHFSIAVYLHKSHYMKRILLAILLLGAAKLQAQNMELSTLRIGEFKIYMDAEEAAKIAKKKLEIPTEQNSYSNQTKVKYNNELLDVTITENYYDAKNKAKYLISSLNTKSPAFKTKSGIGIGSTREEVLNAYKNYTSFEMYPNWGEGEEKPKPGDCIFTLNDLDAGTALSFVMLNNKVVEIRIYIDEGC